MKAKTIGKINETKRCFFETMNKIDKFYLAKLTKKKERENTNYQYENERGEINIDLIDIKMKKREFCKQRDMYKFSNMDEMDRFFEYHKHTKVTQEEIDE